MRKIFKLKLGIFFVCALNNVYTYSDALCSDHSHNRNLGNKIRTYWKSALASDRGNNDSPDRYELSLNDPRISWIDSFHENAKKGRSKCETY